VEFLDVVIDKAISAVEERFDSLQVHHNNFGFLYNMKKLNEKWQEMNWWQIFLEPGENAVT